MVTQHYTSRGSLSSIQAPQKQIPSVLIGKLLKELELRLTIKLGAIVVVVIGLLVALSRLKII